MKTIAILGTGAVGQALATGFRKQGFEVVMGTQQPEKMIEWKDPSLASIPVKAYEEAAKAGELITIAVKGAAAEGVVKSVVPSLSGKTVIDVTNPIADAPPQDGVLKFFTSLDQSLMERLQALAPQANFVKAFNSVGNALMVNPDFGGIRPTMFICGNSGAAKREVEEILGKFGWEVADMGTAAAARAIEPLCILWCIPGFLRNDWAHAFKLLRK
ncbi:MAG: NAD(P)-binding domain-containing protein [Candidatus Sungbacteria bacterium]|uniref:NAD(P)-binding domain-containing protein n=1 Tax=Candidatus Sungiibacteriota bacterium TaxID=2750080 RepID=A0A932YYG6_9BACT|nr:NAD(P)-binding domain-containing protein [Candidatus Sungbacteria bacterium]